MNRYWNRNKAKIIGMGIIVFSGVILGAAMKNAPNGDRDEESSTPSWFNKNEIDDAHNRHLDVINILTIQGII